MLYQLVASNMLKNTIWSDSISFVAIIASLVTIIWSSLSMSTDLDLLAIITGIISSGTGIAIWLLFKKLKRARSKIFISYAREDRAIALEIRNMLLNNNFIVNIDTNEILPGQRFDSTILKELESSSIFILILSKNRVSSGYVEYEFNRAINSSKQIIPVLVDNDAQIPELINNIQFADLRTDRKTGSEKLLESIKRLL
jgi:hypothetical protein